MYICTYMCIYIICIQSDRLSATTPACEDVLCRKLVWKGGNTQAFAINGQSDHFDRQRNASGAGSAAAPVQGGVRTVSVTSARAHARVSAAKKQLQQQHRNKTNIDHELYFFSLDTPLCAHQSTIHQT